MHSRPTRPPAKRLFVALPLDDRARAAVARVAEQLRERGLRGRFVRPENYHFTLAFLGNVALEGLEAVIQAVERSTRSGPVAPIPLERIGAFPSERRARTVWLGPVDTPPAYVKMHAALHEELARAAFALDAKPQAHVTLCRCDGVRVPALARTQPIAVAVHSIVVYSSLTLPEGPRYTCEHAVPLARLCNVKR